MIALLVAILVSNSEQSSVYTAPKMPKLTSIPHKFIMSYVKGINIRNHNITRLGPNEFSKYHKLKVLWLADVPLKDNIHPTAFSGTNIHTLYLKNVGLTNLPHAVLSLNKTLTLLNLNGNNNLTKFTALQYLMNISKQLYRVDLQHKCILDNLPNLICLSSYCFLISWLIEWLPVHLVVSHHCAPPLHSLFVPISPPVIELC